MRDDLPPHPVFHTAAPDEDRPLEFRPSYNPVQPPEPVSPWRIAAVGAVAACALGVVAAVAVPGHHGGDKTAAKASATTLPYRPISARYAPPDRARILAAYDDAARLVAQEGLSGAARGSMACFDRLAQRSDYGLMDYCLALDAFGAQAYARAAGEAAPPSTYFGQGSVRRQQAVQMLTAGQTDANSRLIDTNRIIGEVALQASVGAPPQPQAAGVTTAPVAEVPAPSPAVALPAAPIQASAPETVKVFRPAPTAEPIRVATPLAAKPTKATPVILRPKPEPLAVKPAKPAPTLIRIKVMPPPKPAKVAPPAPKPTRVIPARVAKVEKPAKATPAPRTVLRAVPPARVKAPPAPAPVKAKVQIARAAPPKTVPAKPALIRSRPAPAPDSTPWMSKLEAVLKRPAPSEAKAAPTPKDPPAAERKSASPPAEAKPSPEPAAVAERARPAVLVERAPAAPAAKLAPPQATRQEASRDDVRPSFDCRSAVTRGQRLVCNEPALAAADRRLSSVFNRALNEANNPRALVAEQNRWLALRDQLAPNYQAVMNLYQDRIAELRQPRY